MDRLSHHILTSKTSFHPEDQEPRGLVQRINPNNQSAILEELADRFYPLP